MKKLEKLEKTFEKFKSNFTEGVKIEEPYKSPTKLPASSQKGSPLKESTRYLNGANTRNNLAEKIQTLPIDKNETILASQNSMSRDEIDSKLDIFSKNQTEMVTQLVNKQLEGVFALIGDPDKNYKEVIEAEEGGEKKQNL